MILNTTIFFLKLLCENYKEGKIDYFTFCLHSRVKLLYLKENYIDVINPIEKKRIQDVIKQCEDISSVITVNA